MGLFGFLSRVPERGIRESLGELRVGVRRRTGWLADRSTHVYDRDWDVLVVLDACRVDLMREVVTEYDFLSDPASIYSVAPTSRSWIERTFGPLSTETLARTGYVTGNLFSDRVEIRRNAFGVFDEVWRDGYEEKLGGIPPETITNRAIHAARTQSPDRLIVHYMQSHVPFLYDPDLGGQMGREDGRTVWDALADGQEDEARVWEAYKRNLRGVLDEVAVLRRNLDADRLVVSSDHGNAMGEHGQYGHGPNKLVDAVCTVPWIRTDATDQKTRVPDIDRSETVEPDQIARLRALGYR